MCDCLLPTITSTSVQLVTTQCARDVLNITAIFIKGARVTFSDKNQQHLLSLEMHTHTLSL